MKKFTCLILSFFLFFSLFAQRPIVQDIQARRGRGTKINIYWVLPENPDKEITKILLYRNTKQISSAKLLSSSKLIAELDGSATGYVDQLKDFKDYFYAAVAVTDKPYEVIMLSMNSTTKGVHLEPAKKADETEVSATEEKLYTNGTKRETPLPYLDFLEGLDSESQITQTAVDATKPFSSNYINKNDDVLPYFFEEDLISPDGGDDYLLFDILKNTFVQEKYNASIPMLSKLTKTRIDQSVQQRAYFYMGEAYYFTGKYSEAVMCFIQVEDVFPLLTKKWITTSLDKLSKEN